MARLNIPRPLSSPLWRLGLIVLLNLIPVGGVLWLGWDAGQILMLYWIENLIIGVLALSRILTARGVDEPVSGDGPEGPVKAGCFFMVHYGVFTLVHGVFTVMLAARIVGGAGPLWERVLAHPAFHWAILATAALQVVIWVRDWWGSGLWRTSTPFMEMFRPYGRIVVLHVTVLACAWWLGETSAPAWAVLILCLTKGVVELVLTAVTTPDET